MANLIITSTTNTIKVDFGIHTNTVGYSNGTWRKGEIVSIKQLLDERIEVYAKNGEKWTLSYTNGSNFLVVDSVDGAAPADDNDLYAKLIALIV